MPFDASPRDPGILASERGLPGASAATEERRESDRRPVSVSVHVVGLGDADVVPCTAADLSEGGMCLHAPASSGLQVGQRCELTVCAADGTAETASALVGRHYATVVRTERFSEGVTPMIGAGMRFDQPLFL